jgi:hypothetical protein
LNRHIVRGVTKGGTQMIRSIRTWRLRLAVLLVIAVLAGTAAAALAGRQHQTAGVIVSGGGGSLSVTRISTYAGLFSTMSSSFTNIPGGTVYIPVPAGATMLIVAEFTAQTGCGDGNSATASCEARIMIAGGEANPKTSSTGSDPFYLDSTHGPGCCLHPQGHAFTRSRTVHNASNVTWNAPVTVQIRVDSGDVDFFRLDNYHL